MLLHKLTLVPSIRVHWRITQSFEKSSPPVNLPGVPRRLYSMATVESAFDEACHHHITQKLAGYPVELKHSAKYGNGLYATEHCSVGSTIFREAPMLRFPRPPKRDIRVDAAFCQAPPGFEVDFSLVAQAVSLIVGDAESKTKHLAQASESADLWSQRSFANKHIPLRCLSWSVVEIVKNDPQEQHGLEMLTQVIARAFPVGDDWNKHVCEILFNKIKTNMFDSHSGVDVFEAASMLNHSCEPNVRFNPHDGNEVQALKKISAGEQLFISYEVANPAVDLPELYGFECVDTCSRCKRK